MYKIFTANSKTEKELIRHTSLRNDIPEKLDKLKEDPRRANGAHPLKGELKGKWACWLGSNLRIMYLIDEDNKLIKILAIGTHKIY